MITSQMLKKAGLSSAKAFLIHLKFPEGTTKDRLIETYKGTQLEKEIILAINKIN